MVIISPSGDLASHPLPANAADGHASQPPNINSAATLFDEHWTQAGSSQPSPYASAPATSFAVFNFNPSSSPPMFSECMMNNFFVPPAMAESSRYRYQPYVAPTPFAQDATPPPLLVPMLTTRAEPFFHPQTQSQGANVSAEEAMIVHAVPDTEKDQGDTTPTPRRRGRPRKNAIVAAAAATKPNKRAAVRSDQATSHQAASATAISGQVHVPLPIPDQATSVVEVQVQHPNQAALLATSNQTAQCTNPMPLVYQEQWQLQPTYNNNTLSTGAQAIAVVEQEAMPPYADTSAEGVRFQPTDEELIFYLRLKYAGREMPVDFFKEFDVYQAYPEKSRDVCGVVNGCWYAFSPRDRKYKNGHRPKRSVVEAGGQQLGYWKSNTKLTSVCSRADGSEIGTVASLTFHLGNQPHGTQTPWKMREYAIPKNQHAPDGSAMRLNDWVLCKLFYKERVIATRKRGSQLGEAAENDSGDSESSGDEGGDESIQMGSTVDQTPQDSEQDLRVEDYLVLG
ncbi:hypothetical protein HU200_025443 [Digitaria exilis]|uniref:NAC domain-containing protein n=1 Tax=Digitaria exilis TaxID=1010633 RepID=A0A835EV39_9POAL|nr:hypothetical protein HU200_025443 [Digitaria exilis]